MAVMLRVGSGMLREPFSADLLEEIRIMAEAGQAHLVESVPAAVRPGSPFAAMLARVLDRAPGLRRGH